jgi:hypothetical protein
LGFGCITGWLGDRASHIYSEALVGFFFEQGGTYVFIASIQQ